MKFKQLDVLVLEDIIPKYLNLKDKVNYFRALGLFTPERFFVSNVMKNEKGGLSKKKLFFDLYFIKHNLFNLSEKCLRILKYQHWLYISACMAINRDFILKHRDKLVVSALVNNANCFTEINLWLVDRKNSNLSLKVFNCLNCGKKFTTYISRRISNQYYLHYCYVHFFQYSNSLNIKEFILWYISFPRHEKLLIHYVE